jgi:hypothetical protein
MSGILGSGFGAVGSVLATPAGAQLFGIGSQALTASGILPAFIRAGRKIGTIIPDVTIEEHHNDRWEITQHPIANGTPVTDHIYRQPAQVTMRLGWTNANPVGAAVGGFMQGGGFSDIGGGLLGAGQGLLGSATEQRVKDIYKHLLAMQTRAPGDTSEIKPFELTTGKRTYPAMLISEISVSTDRHSEYALIMECRMQEVILVKPVTETAAGPGDHALPQQTAPTTDAGQQQPQPKDESSLSGLVRWFKGTPAP